MSRAIEVGDMIAFPISGIYVTGRVTRLLPKGYLVKTAKEGWLCDVDRSEAMPMRNEAESEAVIRVIAGLPNSN